ncbi:flavin reductase family protein [Thalassobaculum sp.]|uniref:flavin reductase family protein n=1 Tax=Thalassobaculum sp. TaxID=2022740 RepID=UPI0032EF36F8
MAVARAMTNDPTLRDRFLDAMSATACTVNIVTTDGTRGRAGVTVSAMSSISADTDQPTLLVCVHHLSPAADAILKNRAFCVNVLRDDQSIVADRFAGRVPAINGDKFAGSIWAPMASGVPRVVDPLAAFDCRLLSYQRVGTHFVLVGAADDIFVAGSGKPLVYARRAYATAVPL